MQGVRHDISKVCKMSKAAVQWESHGVWPKPQAHIPRHGTLKQGIFYFNVPYAHSFHGVFGTLVAWGPHHGCHGVGRKWPQGIKSIWGVGCGNLPSPPT